MCGLFDSIGPERIRAFIAIPIDPDVRKTIASTQQALANSVPERAVRWTPPEQIHLTLKFLGEVPVNSLADIQAVLGPICGSHLSLQLAAATLGCFPNERDPRVLWVGLTGDLGPLKTLVEQMEKQLSRWVAPEVREFHPHLTIGRIKLATPATRQALRAAMYAHAADSFGSWRVNRVQLFQSELTPTGSRYTVLQAWPLGG